MATQLVRTPGGPRREKLRVPGPHGRRGDRGARRDAGGRCRCPTCRRRSTAVDGALIPWEIIPPLEAPGVDQYQIEGGTRWRFGTTTFQVSMNKAAWDGAAGRSCKAVLDTAPDEAWLTRARRHLARERRRRHQDRGRGRQRAHRARPTRRSEAFRRRLAPVVDTLDRGLRRRAIDGPALVERRGKAIGKHTEFRAAETGDGYSAAARPGRRLLAAGSAIIGLGRCSAGSLPLALTAMTAASAGSNVFFNGPSPATTSWRGIVAIAAILRSSPIASSPARTSPSTSSPRG